MGYISLILLILIGGSIIAFLSRTKEQARITSLISSWGSLGLAISMLLNFDPSKEINFEELYTWIPAIGIDYRVGVDGISMPMVLLTAITSAFCTIYAWEEERRSNLFFGFMLLISFALMGVFVSLNFFLFFVFWDLVLVPMFFFIGIWGGPRKDYAAMKFLIYTLTGSVIMLLGILAIFYFHGKATGFYTFDMITLLSAYKTIPIPHFWREFIFGALLFSFLVKMPAVPLHTWLPDAHVEAPTVGSIFLAGVLLKMGGYGLPRFLVPMISNASPVFIYVIAIFGVVSILYTPLAALPQRDIKKLIAFSSIGHMGFISLGIAAFMAAGSETSRVLASLGAVLQLFAHGIVTSVLFGSAGIIEHHVGTRIFQNLGGLYLRMPKFSLLMILGFLASMGVPGMIGFVVEFSVLAGSYPQLPYFVIAALFSIPLSVIYHLYAIKKAIFGFYKGGLERITDISWYEFVPMAMWISIIIVFGFYPAPILNLVRAASAGLITILPPGGIVL